MLGMGYVMIISNKWAHGKSVIPMTFHSIAGTLTLLVLIAQVAIGYRKSEYASKVPEKKVNRYHGEMGMLLFDCINVTIILGLLSFLPWDGVHLLVSVCVFFFWFCIHSHMRTHLPSQSLSTTAEVLTATSVTTSSSSSSLLSDNDKSADSNV